MEYDTWQLGVVTFLEKLVERRGATEGGREEIFERLGLPGGFLRDMRRRLRIPNRRLPFNDLFRVFERFGEHPVVALYEAGRTVDPGLPELPIEAPYPPTSAMSKELLEELETWMKEESATEAGAETPLEAQSGYRTWRRLHRLVLSAPLVVLDQARPALTLASRALRPRILAVVGTALRKSGDLDGATHLIEEARQQAKTLGDLWAEADATQRLSRVTLLRGEIEEAIHQVREAGSLYTELGDRAGVGRTLLSQGHYFAHREDFARAESLFRAALRELPPDEVDFRFSAFTNLARSASQMGQPTTALRWLRSATAHREGVGDELIYVCFQMRGVLAFENGHSSEAVDCFYDCRDYYLGAGDPLEATYSTVWLCHALLEEGRIGELMKVANESLQLVGLLKRHPTAAAVMVSLVRQLKRGRIRATQLVKYRQRLEAVRGRGASSDEQAP